MIPSSIEAVEDTHELGFSGIPMPIKGKEVRVAITISNNTIRAYSFRLQDTTTIKIQLMASCGRKNPFWMIRGV